MISILHWNGNTRSCRPATVEELPATAAAVAPDDVWWIDLSEPTPKEEEQVFEMFFRVHPLTFEDITKSRREPEQGTHLPKVEEFPDYLFVIVNPLPPGLAEKLRSSVTEHPLPLASSTMNRRKHRPQLNAVLNHRVLVTHHYQPLACVQEARTFLDRHADTAHRGPDFIFHHVLDAMVDEYAPIVDRVVGRLDVLETRLFNDPTPRLLGRLLRLKRVVTGLRKTLILEREVLARLTRGEFELVDTREVAYYRNVYDHLVRYTELIESAREMVSDLMETHLSAVSNRLNEVMKVLAMISTTVMPMTLVAGIYGMNFKYLPELEWRYGYLFALSLMALLGMGSLVFFRWMRWL